MHGLTLRTTGNDVDDDDCDCDDQQHQQVDVLRLLCKLRVLVISTAEQTHLNTPLSNSPYGWGLYF